VDSQGLEQTCPTLGLETHKPVLHCPAVSHGSQKPNGSAPHLGVGMPNFLGMHNEVVNVVSMTDPQAMDVYSDGQSSLSSQGRAQNRMSPKGS